jgi:hypothetical protein
VVVERLQREGHFTLMVIPVLGLYIYTLYVKEKEKENGTFRPIASLA